jgi:hypothetical protein
MRSEQEIFGGYELVFLIMHICWFRKYSHMSVFLEHFFFFFYSTGLRLLAFFTDKKWHKKNGPSVGIVYQVVAFRGKKTKK